ncbi:uncharacterized protein Hap1MRO34_007927 isoform 1-T2 [Clarias gariepinus]
MARLSTATRYKVVILHQQGLSQAKISKQTGVSRCAVQAILKKHKETGKVSDRRRSGRPRKLNASDEIHIMLSSLRHQKMSSSAISKELAESSGTQVHPSTVRRSKARSGLHGRMHKQLDWRAASPLQPVQEKFLQIGGSEASLADAHRRAALPVREDLLQTGSPKGALADSHRRKTLSPQPVRQEVLALGTEEASLEHPHGQEALSLHPVQQELQQEVTLPDFKDAPEDP